MPNGRDLIFSSTRGGRLELWHVDALGSKRITRVADAGEGPRDLAIARQGQRLVYTREFQDENIWRAPLNGSRGEAPQNFIASTKVESFPQYSPDGRKIAFESSRGGNEEIWVCNQDGSAPGQLTSLGKWSGSPRWSPDSQEIAFDSDATGNWDVYTIKAQGGRPTRLTTNSADDDQPSWSRDGNWIYFRSNRTGKNQIWKMRATGGEETQVTRIGWKSGDAPLAYDHDGLAIESEDGQHLYFLRDSALWQVRGSRESKVLESSDFFAPTGNGIYFLQGPTLLFLDFTTRSANTVISLGPVASGISVSPDGRWMLYSRIDHQGSDLMLVEGFH